MEQKSTVTFADFMKLDLRVGRVVGAVEMEKSNSLIKMQVDLGPDIGERTIMAGVRKWYRPEDLSGKKLGFVVNLEPKQMMGEESQGMLLALDTSPIDGEENCILFPVLDEVPVGAVIR